MSNFITFEESLHIKDLSLYDRYSRNFTLQDLQKLKDFETINFEKNLNYYQDYLGHPVLRNYISKIFYKNANIVLRPTIFELKTIISNKLPNYEEIEIDSSQDEALSRLEALDASDKLYFYDDFLGIDYSRIDIKNKIIFGSIDTLTGIAGINLAWAITNNENAFEIIKNFSIKSGPALSYHSELFALIAIRNFSLISSANKKILEENKSLILKKQKEFGLDLDISFSPSKPECFITKNDLDMNDISKSIVRNLGIFLECTENNITLQIGRKNIENSISEIFEFISKNTKNYP